MPGACCTRGLVCNGVESCAHEHTGTAGALRHSLRNGLTAYAALSLETNSSCLHRCRLDGEIDPVGSKSPPAAWHQPRMPGPHGFAVRFSAVRPARRARSRITALRTPSRARRCCVHRIPPRVRDDRDPPLVRDETAGVLVLIWGGREANCFCARGWTGQITLNWREKLLFASKPQGRRRMTLRCQGSRKIASASTGMSGTSRLAGLRVRMLWNTSVN
ncbi:hypothetical protein V1288_000484 [Bradyrhizobium sp. AZCC 2176]